MSNETASAIDPFEYARHRLAEHAADDILTAAGSGLRHYTMPSIRAKIIEVTRKYTDPTTALSGLNPEAVGEVVEALEGLLKGRHTPETYDMAFRRGVTALAKLREVKP